MQGGRPPPPIALARPLLFFFFYFFPTPTHFKRNKFIQPLLHSLPPSLNTLIEGKGSAYSSSSSLPPSPPPPPKIPDDDRYKKTTNIDLKEDKGKVCVFCSLTHSLSKGMVNHMENK